MKKKSEIFISYRRQEGQDTARMLKESLERLGYEVFIDLDKLQGGVFDKQIFEAIREAKVLILLLNKHTLDQCYQEDDWIRREIECAIGAGTAIVPLNVNKQFEAIPDSCPASISEVLKHMLITPLDTDQLYQESVRKLHKERLQPRLRSSRRMRRIIGTIAGIALLLAAAGGAGYAWAHRAQYYLAQGDSCLQKADAAAEEDTLHANAYFKQAIAYFEKAAEAGEVMGYARIGDCYVDPDEAKPGKYDDAGQQDNIASAIHYFSLGAEAGDPYAMGRLAMCYRMPANEEPDFKKSIYWAQKADTLGEPLGAQLLGMSCFKSKKWEKAYRYFSKGADKGNSFCKSYKGMMLSQGRGVAIDFPEGMKLMIEAVQEGRSASYGLSTYTCWIPSPEVDSANIRNVRIAGISMMTDSRMKVCFEWHSRDEQMGIDPQTYLLDPATGAQYTLCDIELMRLRPDYKEVPEGSVQQFFLYFDSVPDNLTMADIVEPCADGLMWKGIHMDERQTWSGRKIYRQTEDKTNL